MYKNKHYYHPDMALFLSRHVRTFSVICQWGCKADLGCLPFTRRNRKFRLENQTVRVIPFGKVQKFWAAGWGDAYFLFFLVSSADLATL